MEIVAKQLTFIKEMSWPDVFNVWRLNEDYPDSHWIPLWQERGFSSWEAWRQTYVKPLELDKAQWALYKIKEPMLTVPEFCGGPFRSWVELFYEGKTSPSFNELSENPKIKSHKGTNTFMNNFPIQTTVSGIIVNEKIVIVEGMHRCAAIGLAAKLNKTINTDMNICLGKSNLTQLPMVGNFKK